MSLPMLWELQFGDEDSNADMSGVVENRICRQWQVDTTTPRILENGEMSYVFRVGQELSDVSRGWRREAPEAVCIGIAGTVHGTRLYRIARRIGPFVRMTMFPKHDRMAAADDAIQTSSNQSLPLSIATISYRGVARSSTLAAVHRLVFLCSCPSFHMRML